MMARVLMLWVLAALVGCRTNPLDVDADGGSTVDAGGPRPVLGGWVSEGDDLEPLNDLLRLQGQPTLMRVVVTFGSDDYEVVSTGEDGLSGASLGDYTLTGAEEPDAILGITMVQRTPMPLTAEGIVQVQGDTLRLETVPTDPAPVFPLMPPTPEGGFGTTGLPIQVYARQ